MVKTDPRKARRQVVPQEVDQLARLFRNRVAVEDPGRRDDEGEDESEVEVTSATNMEVASGSTRPKSAIASVDGRPFRSGRPAVGFEVDLEGSQMSDLPFLRPLLAEAREAAYRKKKVATIKYRTTTMMKREKRFVCHRRVRFDPRTLEMLIYLARREVMNNISHMAPEFTQHLKNWDAMDPEMVDWKAIKTWLDEHLEVVDRMHLTPRAVGVIATYPGRERGPPSIDMLKVMSLNRSLHLDSNVEKDTIREISAFVFPEDFTLPCATV